MSASQRPDKAEIDYKAILNEIREYKQIIVSVVAESETKTYPEGSLQSLRVAAYKELGSRIDTSLSLEEEPEEARGQDKILFYNLCNFIKSFFSKDKEAFKHAELKEHEDNATLIKGSKSFYQYIANEDSCLPRSGRRKYSETDMLLHIERQSKLFQHLETLKSHKENKYDIPERSKAFKSLAEKLQHYLSPGKEEHSISKNVDTSTLLYIEAFLAEDEKQKTISIKTKGQTRAVSQEFYRQIPIDLSDETYMSRNMSDRTATEAVVKSHFKNIIKSTEEQATHYVTLELIAAEAATQAEKPKESKESKAETIYSTIKHKAEVDMKDDAIRWKASLMTINTYIKNEFIEKNEKINKLIGNLNTYKGTLIQKALEHLRSLYTSITKIPKNETDENRLLTLDTLQRLIKLDTLLNTEGAKLISMIHNSIQDFIPTLQPRPRSAIKCLQQKDPVNYKDSALGIDCYIVLLLLIENFKKTVTAEEKLENAEAKIGFENKMDIFQVAFTKIISPDMPQDPWAELTKVEKELAAIDRRVILNSEMKRFDYDYQIENSISSDEKKDAISDSKEEAKDIYAALKNARNHAIEAYKQRIQKLQGDTSIDANNVLKACQEEKIKFEQFINYAERLNEQVIVASRRLKTKNWTKKYEAKDYFPAFLGAVSAVYDDYSKNRYPKIDPAYHSKKMEDLRRLDKAKKKGPIARLREKSHFTQLIDNFNKLTDQEHPYLIWSPPESKGTSPGLFNKQNKTPANLQRFRDLPKSGSTLEHKHASRPGS